MQLGGATAAHNRGNDEAYGRLTAMNPWLVRHCREQGYMFEVYQYRQVFKAGLITGM